MGQESRQDSRPRMGRESWLWTGQKSRMWMGRGSRTQGRRRRQPAARFLVSRRALLSPSRLPFPPSTGASQMDASLAGGMRALLPLSRALAPLFPARTQRSALSPAHATRCVFPAFPARNPRLPAPARGFPPALARARRPPRASRRHMATTWGARRRHTRGCRGEPDAMVQKTPGRQGVALKTMGGAQIYHIVPSRNKNLLRFVKKNPTAFRTSDGFRFMVSACSRLPNLRNIFNGVKAS